MTTQRKKAAVKSKSVTPRGARTTAGQKDRDNLPPVSRQTAGGIAGAAIGGIVAGPLGAVVTGVAGALVGNASASGDRPVERTVEGIREVAEPPIRRAYKRMSAAVARHRVDSRKKTTARKTEASALAKKASTRKPAAKARAARKPSKAAK